jgi:hypothetical protein
MPGFLFKKSANDSYRRQRVTGDGKADLLSATKVNRTEKKYNGEQRPEGNIHIPLQPRNVPPQTASRIVSQ